MTSKERVKTALAHKRPDKIPVDFGGTPVTGIHVLAVENLRKYFGLENKPVKVIEPFQMLGEIDNELLYIMGVDIIGFAPRNNMFGFANENWKGFKTGWGQVVLVPGNFDTTIDKQGDFLIYPEGDTTAAPSAKMPKGGYFFDAVIRQEPIVEAALDPEDNLEEFTPVSDTDLKYIKNKINELSKLDKGIIANFGGTGLGDIALVPGLNLKNPKGIRDVSEWYISTVIRQDYIHEIFDSQTNLALKNLEKVYQVVGNRIDAVFICGTDFGTQTSQFCSVTTFNALYAPYYKKINDWIHQNTTWKTFKHSCGAVVPLIQSFIECGFYILNPVQINATGMDPKYLKETYGDKLVFWGGGIDTQKVLAFGSPEEVRKQVLDNCRIFGENGGFVFNTVHNIQANVPVENLVAMLKAIEQVNR